MRHDVQTKASLCKFSSFFKVPVPSRCSRSKRTTFIKNHFDLRLSFFFLFSFENGLIVNIYQSDGIKQ